ncbi:MAG: DUF5982 domain-containing protein [Bacteroidales bacterium]|nr:DUF5982 domain-containing protein [Bacteroidales bacterium]
MKKLCLAIIILTTSLLTHGQENPADTQTQEETKDVKKKKREKKKQGWTFGALPVVSYDTDIGFQYGALVNLYKYDSTRYPNYDHSIYAEWSQTTKGSGIIRLAYDSEHLIKGIRITSDIAYLTDKAIYFYGFNGYESVYNQSWEDDEDPDYVSRQFYRHERKIFKFLADFQGKISGEHFLWYAGISFMNFKVAPVDVNRLNEGKPDDQILPDTSIYQNYVDWGILTPEESAGGNANYVSGGIVYDSRDNEPNPMKGIWTELVLRAAPSFMGNKDFAHLKLAITHRQYFTIIPKNLSFAYRIGFQATLAGKTPFYAQPMMLFSFYRGALPQGLGGGKTLRGIRRNRVVGSSIIYGNFEFRWKIIHTKLFKQNLYIALNGFLDTGRTLGEYKTDLSGVPSDINISDYFDTGNENFHLSAGGGVRFALNQNFIVAVDFGKALDKRDGNTGVYVGLNYLF